MTPDQIAELKRIAEAAANAALGDWRANFVPEGDSDGLTGYAPDGTFSRVGDFGGRDLNLTHEDVALHIDTFDPPTCLALIARIEALEAGLKPFARAAELVSDEDEDAGFDLCDAASSEIGYVEPAFTSADFRRAANLLGGRHD